MEGGCACGEVRYRLSSKPMFVHACHCTWCQRESGAAFAVNAMIETDRVHVLRGGPEEVETPSASGRGQLYMRCPTCHVAVWSHYAGSGRRIAFVRVGTLDQPHDVNPDIHIYTSTKRPWVIVPPEIPAVAEWYDRETVWPKDALARRAALMG